MPITPFHFGVGAALHAVDPRRVDVRPFAPWNDLNPFYALISLGWLHLACLLAGAFGIGLIALRERWRQ